MRKMINCVPKDILTILGCIVITAFFLPRWAGYVLLLLFVIGIVVNVLITRKKYGRYKYILMISAFFKKKELYVAMIKFPCAPYVGDRDITDMKDDKIFECELEQMIDTVPGDVTFSCCTQSKYKKIITERFFVLECKKSHKQKMKSLYRKLRKKASNNKKQFYVMKFRTNKGCAI